MEIDHQDDTGPAVGKIWRLFVFALGLLLIALGLWALGGAILAAWELFRDPDSIAYFARYFLETTKLADLVPGGEGLAHYIAWVAVILLLLVLGKLGAWALGAGALLLNPGCRK